jgi:hypothetical protein
VSTDADDFLFGGGVPSASFKTIGQSIRGVIVGKGVVQKTDFKTKEKLFYKDGNPIEQLVVTLKTNERDPERDSDDGTRKVYASNSMKSSIALAARKAGLKTLSEGATMEITFVREVPSDAGSPKKEYDVVITPASAVAADAALQASAPATTAVAQPAAQATATAAPATPGIEVSPELLAALQAQLTAAAAAKG